jgi:hypothetical protein
MTRGWEIDATNTSLSAGTDGTERLDWWLPAAMPLLPQAVSSALSVAARPSARNVLETDIDPCYAPEVAGQQERYPCWPSCHGSQCRILVAVGWFQRGDRGVAAVHRPPGPNVEALQRAELQLIERLVHRDRTAVSSAVLAVAGIGAGGARRRAVLARVGEVARSAQARGATSRERGAQIARHVNAALEASEARIAIAA